MIRRGRLLLSHVREGTSALSILRFGVRLQFVAEVGVIGLFQDITQLSTPLPRNASCSPRVSLRTRLQVPVGEGRVRGVFRNAWAGRLEGVTSRGEHESPSPRPSPAGQRRSLVVIDDCSTRTVRGRGLVPQSIFWGLIRLELRAFQVYSMHTYTIHVSGLASLC